MFSEDLTTAIRSALAGLGIERLTLAIHDASFPSEADEDVGRGSPYGKGARTLLRFASGLGFDSLQLGPQGDTSESNPSPYDGALFTKSPMSIALASLAEEPEWSDLCEGLLRPAVEGRPWGDAARVQHSYAWRTSRLTLERLYERFVTRSAGSALAARFASFRAEWGPSLVADGLYEALSNENESDDWRRWGSSPSTMLDSRLFGPLSDEERPLAFSRRQAIAAAHPAALERHLFGQFVLDEQHRTFRLAASSTSIAVFGDLQIGFSHRDDWSQRESFRADYLMGAPPSRTNPGGQAWGYPVLDVEGAPERVLALLTARVTRMVADFDGIRIDHPHGLVCPWVYKVSEVDPADAVLHGARLRCSPNLPDHPALARLAIPTADDLSRDPATARYADDWVRVLDDAQVARYGRLFDVVMSLARTAGWQPTDVVCEVLSTWPYPLRRVMARHGLGRFCVTQKADLARADDVYRGENATSADWIMVGNHDTPPIWRLAATWHGTPAGAARAMSLAGRLAPRPVLRLRLLRWLESDARHLCQGMFAELFLGPARRVSVFFPDLFGIDEIYNRPGVVHADNWTLRLQPDFMDRYRSNAAAGRTFNVPLALALALAAGARDSARAPLVRRLASAARELAPDLDPEIWSILESASLENASTG